MLRPPKATINRKYTFLIKMPESKNFFLRIISIGLILSQFVFFAPVFGQLSGNLERREAELRSELADIEKEIALWQAELRQKQNQSASFERDISILNAKIREAQATIRARNIEIERLGREINFRLQTIEELDEKVARSKVSLSQLLRKTNEVQSFSLVEIVLSNDDLSEFLIDLDTFNSVNNALNVSFQEIREAKRQLEIEKEQLGVQRNKEVDIRIANEAERRKIEQDEAEQKRLLELNKTQERTYAQIVADRQRKAAQIRAALFALRDTAAIPFGQALEYAEEAQKLTGIRPAFLLAVITQESNMGANIGTCNRPQDTKKWREIMPGPEDIAKGWSKRNDQAAYLRITGELGLDPDSMPLSCPWGNGWGGAMGPSQFIPTTWEMYKSKVASASGRAIPNPWDPRDAFLASAIYLSELGASAGGYTSERTAALRYYAGGNWNKPSNAFYGDQVMGHARRIQEEMIDPLLNL